MTWGLMLLILIAPSSRAHGPAPRCDVDLVTDRPKPLPLYLNYLVMDGILGPVERLEAILIKMNEVHERDLIDHVLERIGPAAQVLPRVADMIHLAENLTQLDRGYQALTSRCGRVADDLRSHRDDVSRVILRSHSVLNLLDLHLTERPGRDTAWVRDKIRHVHAAIDHFRSACFDGLPPQSRGFWDAINRVLAP